jgi:hypothetical protein
VSFSVSKGIQGCTGRDSSRCFVPPSRGRTLDEYICVVVKSQLGDLVDNLVVTTDKLIKGLATTSLSSSPSNVQRNKLRISPVYLAWSVALRACRDVIIQTSIEYVNPLLILVSFIYFVPRVGQSRKYIYLAKSYQSLRNHVPLGYWCNLQSSLDFAHQPLRDCVNIIHIDIVKIWNLNDRDNVSYPQLPCYFYLPSHGDQYLSSTSFKIKMSHVAKDLAETASGVPMRCVIFFTSNGEGIRMPNSPHPSGSGDKFAEWVSGVYRER